MSMAVSLELRVPFLDRDLIDYVLRVPGREKRRYPGMKGLLVESCRDLLPRRVYDRPKMGFSLPMDQWMRGPLKSFTESGLKEVEKRALLAAGAIPRLQGQFDEHKLHWTRIWSLVVLGPYLAKFADAVGIENLAATLTR
jgi:asparagine synthase (glutamine-hydrolysing)